MATPVMMPKQGQSVESCIISQWFKKKGDSVKTGDLLFSYETDKASFEEEAKADGILLEIFFNEGDEVPVLTNVAVIGKAGESTAEFSPNGAASAPTPTAETPVAQVTSAVAAPVSAPATTGNAKLRVSPRARVMAEKKGVSLTSVKGTGPNGRIIVRDIETTQGASAPAQPVTASPAIAVAPAPVVPASAPVVEQSTAEFEVKKLTNIRKLIAKAMHDSLQNSAQLTHHLSADVRKLLALREEVKKAQKTDPNYPNVTLNDMICWAVIRALEKNPEANSQFLGDSIKTFKQVHLGLAVDTPRGLMVPVLKNANDLSLKGLSNNLRALAEGCRKGGIDPELLQSTAGSFTVSNLGNYGVEIFTPIINVPQVAILGVNTIIQRPADIGGGIIAFVPYIGLSLTYDHRAIDGGPATLFLKEIKTQIENFSAEIQ
ncbi:MAG: 2-oxo acid dehydrogenase subunit E2 [Bacteroidales bacterium]|jgi:pyruvate dehydrogenase E2 component (dihydrolipoamide acetyltransferase)|nr:2-oxo acid dehydrogenase subunit E2 [Bacteroidales bacterium]